MKLDNKKKATTRGQRKEKYIVHSAFRMKKEKLSQRCETIQISFFFWISIVVRGEM